MVLADNALTTAWPFRCRPNCSVWTPDKGWDSSNFTDLHLASSLQLLLQAEKRNGQDSPDLF